MLGCRSLRAWERGEEGYASKNCLKAGIGILDLQQCNCLLIIKMAASRFVHHVTKEVINTA